jgi:hypothetical protein
MTCQRVSPQQIFVRELVPIVVHQVERSSNLRLSNTLGLIRYPLPCHALLLVCEVRVQASGGGNEEDGGREVEWLLIHVSIHLSIPQQPFLPAEIGIRTCVPRSCCVRALAVSS